MLWRKRDREKPIRLGPTNRLAPYEASGVKLIAIFPIFAVFGAARVFDPEIFFSGLLLLAIGLAGTLRGFWIIGDGGFRLPSPAAARGVRTVLRFWGSICIFAILCQGFGDRNPSLPPPAGLELWMPRFLIALAIALFVAGAQIQARATAKR